MLGLAGASWLLEEGPGGARRAQEDPFRPPGSPRRPQEVAEVPKITPLAWRWADAMPKAMSFAWFRDAEIIPTFTLA